MVPVSIRCTPPSLLKGQRWYQVPRASRVFITVAIGERFAIQPVIAGAENPTLAVRLNPVWVSLTMLAACIRHRA